MMFSRRHEQDLAEIKALHRQLDQRATETLEQIRHIQRAHGISPAASRASVPPLLAFVHIPKTAGGTVTQMLAGANPERGLGRFGNYLTDSERAQTKVLKRSGAGWERWRDEGGRVIAGHTPFGVLRDHLPPDTRYITFLREPTERVLSHYHRHIQRRDPSRAGVPKELRKGRAKANSLQEALLELRLVDLRNLATRFLCDDPSPAGDLPASALAEAKANLREFAFVGLQERFEESVSLLQQTLGLDLVQPDVVENRHVSIDRPTAEEIPDEQRELIEDCNCLDLELYRFAEGLLEDATNAAP